MIQFPPKVYVFIAVSVVVVWAALNITDALNAHYAVPDEINLIMGALVGAAFGGQVIARRNGGRNDSRT